MAGEVALVPEPRPGRDLRPREVVPALRELLDPAGDVPVRGQLGGDSRRRSMTPPQRSWPSTRFTITYEQSDRGPWTRGGCAMHRGSSGLSINAQLGGFRRARRHGDPPLRRPEYPSRSPVAGHAGEPDPDPARGPRLLALSRAGTPASVGGTLLHRARGPGPRGGERLAGRGRQPGPCEGGSNWQQAQRRATNR